MNPITLTTVAEPLIRQALAEDITNEDVSTAAIMPDARPAAVDLIAKADGVLCGLDVFERTFAILDPETRVQRFAADGDSVCAGQTLATVTGDVRVLLSGERVALNYLQRMSGIATYTHRVATQAEGSTSWWTRAKPRRTCACSRRRPSDAAGGATTVTTSPTGCC